MESTPEEGVDTRKDITELFDAPSFLKDSADGNRLHVSGKTRA